MNRNLKKSLPLSTLLITGIIASTLGCFGGGSSSSSSGNSVGFFLLNASSATSVDAGTNGGDFAIGITYGRHVDCPQFLPVPSSGSFSHFVVNKNLDATTIYLDDTTPLAATKGDGPFVIAAYGIPASMQDEKINLAGGSGSDHDLWVSQFSAADGSNYQVSVHDNTAGTDTIVSPVQGITNHRTNFEEPLVAGHSYKVTLDNGTKSYNVSFTAKATGQEAILVYLTDKPGTTTQELLETSFSDNGCPAKR